MTKEEKIKDLAGQDKYCVSCDISDKKDYTSVVIIHDDLKITKSELVKTLRKTN